MEFSNLSGFQKLIIIKIVRPEIFANSMRDLIEEELGFYFVQNLIVSLESSFADSSMTIPLIYVLQPGDDPQDEVKKFAQERGRIMTYVSLGKG